jgi:hypothetical protein
VRAGNREQGTGYREQVTGNREEVTGNTGRKTELIPIEFCMARPRKLSKIKYSGFRSDEVQS